MGPHTCGVQNKAKAPPAARDDKDDDGVRVTVGFPRALVKRVIMCDSDQTRVTANAVDLTGKAAALFLETLAGKAHLEAAGSARSTVNFRDVGAAPPSLLSTLKSGGANAAESMVANCDVCFAL